MPTRRTLAATSAAIAGTASALVLLAAPAQAETAAAPSQACVSITSIDERISGAPNVNLYKTYDIDVHNSCGSPQRVTIDVSVHPDPACKTIQPHSSGNFTYTVDEGYPWGEPRGVTYEC